jgi:hypothetical protein
MNGACHCGAVRFTVRLLDGLDKPRRCNCSYCRMRGAVAVGALLQDLVVTSGGEVLSLYQFNTRTAEHHFCSVCGIYTHHRRRSKPDEVGVNVACLEGVSPFDFACVPVLEGRQHPGDTGTSAIAGHLQYDGLRSKT